MEEKIIDGVDVAGCRRRIGKNSYCRYFKRPCADNNFNCIWKQKARLEQENEELKRKYEENKTVILQLQQWQDEDLRQIAELKQKYEKMVEISKENLIKYEDLRIDNQKLIMEIEGLNSQIDFEAQKQEILFKENVELKSYIKEDLVPHTKIYIQALEEIREIVSGNYETLDPQAKQEIQNIITETIGDNYAN